MKYGEIAGNPHIDRAIYECFSKLEERDAKAFVKKFARMASDEQQRMHVFRELLLGGFLASGGIRVRSEMRIDGQTPDWVVLGERGEPAAIVELVNFHTEHRVEREMNQARDDGGMWTGWLPDNSKRICGRIEDKAATYRGLVTQRDLPYIIAVFGEFSASVDEDDFLPCLSEPENGLFARERHVSGFLFFEEQRGQYQFKYYPNRHALRAFSVPTGLFLSRPA